MRSWRGCLKQNLESVAVLGMLALLHGRVHGIEIPTHETLSQHLVPASLLSWLVARSLYKDSIGAPALGEMYSDTAPVGFEADPFFTQTRRKVLYHLYTWSGRPESTGNTVQDFSPSGSSNGPRSYSLVASGSTHRALNFGRDRTTIICFA